MSQKLLKQIFKNRKESLSSGGGIGQQQQQVTSVTSISTTDTTTTDTTTTTNNTEDPPSSPISSSSSQIQYAKMRIIASPIFHIKDVVRALITSVPKSSELIETLIHYGDVLGATTIHGYLVEKTYETNTLINDEFSVYQGPALCVTFDIELNEQQWEEYFGVHDAAIHQQEQLPIQNEQQNSTKIASFFHCSDFICVSSGSRVVYFDPCDRMTSDERSYVSIFDLETDDIEMFEDQFKPLEYFLSPSKTSFAGTIIRLPLRTTKNQQMITNQLYNLDDLCQQINDYFIGNDLYSQIQLLLSTNLTSITFDHTKDFHTFKQLIQVQIRNQTYQFKDYMKYLPSTTDYPKSITSIINIEKESSTHFLTPTGNNSQLQPSSPQSSTSDNSPTSPLTYTKWLLSIYVDYNETEKCEFIVKLLVPLSSHLPLLKLSSISSSTYATFRSVQLTSIRTLYYSTSISPTVTSNLRQLKFPQAYALMLKDFSRLIKPSSSNTQQFLSNDMLWSLMPDINEQQQLQQNKSHELTTTTIYDIMPDIWSEIGKQELFYSVTDGWGYVAIEDMIINDVEDPIQQEVLTYVFSEANAPIVILPRHIVRGLCKYSNKLYLQVMTPFHASELLSKNSSVLQRLSIEQKLSILTYIILNDPDPGLVLELELLPLANEQFVQFQTKGNTLKNVYILDNEDYLQLFAQQTYEQILKPTINKQLFNILSSKEFQVQVKAERLNFLYSFIKSFEKYTPVSLEYYND
ncbi:unnamed protein product [Didymodactylos carnosus]|uniref:Sacsin/Nov domain-containing protein n=1 Tax=Didymodactylos carnosus TaxID=1234261 RepID=A0A8S2H117_9BILA|nr:unnamed protein product [Didymodactylos carnosus]CAF3578828.1 unnamed protein product [Didymodactylos carnosus]